MVASTGQSAALDQLKGAANWLPVTNTGVDFDLIAGVRYCGVGSHRVKFLTGSSSKDNSGMKYGTSTCTNIIHPTQGIVLIDTFIIASQLGVMEGGSACTRMGVVTR